MTQINICECAEKYFGARTNALTQLIIWQRGWQTVCFSETWSLTMLNFCKVYWMNNLHQIRQTEKTIFKTDNCLVADTAKVRTFDQIRAHVDRSQGFKCKISV